MKNCKCIKMFNAQGITFSVDQIYQYDMVSTAHKFPQLYCVYTDYLRPVNLNNTEFSEHFKTAA